MTLQIDLNSERLRFSSRLWRLALRDAATLCRVIALMGIASAFLACAAGSSRAAAPAPVPVSSGKVILSAVPRRLRALGEVDSLGETTLSAPMTGEIRGPFRTEGEIAAGTVIARIVPPTLQSSIAGARAGLATARTAYARTKHLVAERLRSRLALAQVQGNLVRAEEQLNGLRVEAAQQVIKAPFAGTLHYLISPGTVVYQGTPIAAMSGRAMPWIDLRVSPEAAHDVRVGEPARIAATGWSGTGQVVSIGQDARPLGLVLVRIGLPVRNPLLPGQWVWVQLVRSGAPAPAVAASAVVMRGGRSMVFVLQNGVAHRVRVRVLAEQNGRDWLRASLHPGEQVAVVHAARLVDGSRIAIRSDPSPGTAR